MFDVRDHFLEKHWSLFQGRPDPLWSVPDGWLTLLDYTLEQVWWRLSPLERASVRITSIGCVDGQLVVQGVYPHKCDQLLTDMSDASSTLCVCCGLYAVDQAALPLCRVCAGLK